MGLGSVVMKSTRSEALEGIIVTVRINFQTKGDFGMKIKVEQ